MSRRSETQLRGYTIAMLAVGLATVVRQALDGILGERMPFSTYYVAVIATAWYGGLGPSVASLALGGLAALALFLPGSAADLGVDLMNVSLYLGVGVSIIALSEAHRARGRRLEREVAERNRAEDSAREQAERLRTTLASIGDAVIATDAEGRVEGLNRQAEALTGWTRAEAAGRALEEVFAIFDERTGEPVEAPVAEVLREGRMVLLGNHTALRSRDGTVRSIEDSAAPIRDASGVIRGVVLIFRDVSERWRAERRRGARLAVTQVLAESGSLGEAAPRILRAVCEGLGWDAGGLWLVDERRETIRCREVWHDPAKAFPEFVRATRERSFARGVGLPGRVWGTSEPAWIADVVADPNFPRAGAASSEGLRGAFAAPIRAGERVLGVVEFFSGEVREPDPDLLEMMSTLGGQIGQFLERRQAEGRLQEQTRVAETLHRIGGLVAAELDLDRVVQVVTDEATQITGSQFGAFFYNVTGEGGEAYTLYTISGVPREAFARFPMPRNTPMFGPTFRGEGVVRADDVTLDPRFGRNPPHRGMPEGHLPVRSYLAVPVLARSGEVLGGLFFGHPEAGVFDEQDERIAVGIAAQAAIAIDNARLYREAQESEQRFRQLAEHITDVFWMTDPKAGRVLYVSPAYEAIWGRAAASLYAEPRSFLDSIHPDDRARVEASMASQARGEATGVEYRVVRPDGSVRWVWDRGFPILDAGGAVGRVAGIVEDITERKRAEESLMMQARVLESMTEGVSVCDEAGYILYTNPAEDRIFGYEPGELIGRHVSVQNAYEPGENARIVARVIDELRTRGLWVGEWSNRRKDGTPFTTFARITALEREGRSYWVCVQEDVTERKRAELEMREQNERLRLALEAGGMGTWDWDVPSGRVTWSPSLEAIHGLEPGSFPGTFEAYQRDMHPEDRDRVLASIARAVERKAEHHVEYRLVWPDGSEHWVEARGRPILDESGDVVRMLGVCMDVTERKRLEGELRHRLEQLAEAEQRTRSVVDHVVDGIITIDDRGVVTSFNPAAERIFGYGAGEVVGRNVSMLMPEPYRGEHDAYLAHFLRTGLARIIGVGREVAGLRSDGSTFAMDLAVSEFSLGGGRYFTGIVRDITERKQAEAALRESEARFRQLADAMPQIAWTARPDGNPDYYNRRWYELTGSPEGLGGEESWAPFLHPDDVARCRERWSESVASGEPYEIEYRFWDRNRGEYRWYLGRALPVRDPEGRILKWCGSGTDIDDQKRAEEALREADRRKNQFLATLAHELRNPLAPIRTSLPLLLESGEAPDDLDRQRAMIERQIGNITRLVEDLLDVARINVGKVELHPEPLDLLRVAGHAVETTRPFFDARGHVLAVELPPGPVPVRADPVRMEQVIDNLLNNAAKYTDPGGRIWLSIARDGDSAVVRVRDTGIGIEPAMLPKVFDLFVQAERRVDRAQGGLGIGLCLVKSLVEMHGGSIAAHSEGRGRGSEFVVRLPMLDDAEVAGRPEPSAPAVRPTAPLARRRILVVDDSPDAADSLARLLTRLHRQEVRVAYDGPTAIETARAFGPDVVLLDIGLPGMDGYDVARRLRALPGLGSAVLVAVTGWGQEEDRRRSKEAGFDRHLVKPVDPEAVRDLLAEFEGVAS